MHVDFVELFSERTVWKIAPGEGGLWWESFRDGCYIGLGGPPSGWDEDLGPIQDIDEISEINGPGMKRQYWNFAKEMKKGDIVIVVGAGKIFGVGEVVSDYYHVEDIPHRRRVVWFPLPVLSNKDGRVCRVVWKLRYTLVRIGDKQRLIECGKNLNTFFNFA